MKTLKSYLYVVALLSVALCACKKNEPYVAPAKSFTVAAEKAVYFATGNLQYQPSTHSWRIAENAYDIGVNANPTAETDKWIDLFGWGADGWNGGIAAYQPYAISQTEADYYPGGDYSADLTGEYAQADWGRYALNDGVEWRTLTADEWKYLFEGRANCDSLYAFAVVENIPGLIILPDDWNFEMWGLFFKPGNLPYRDNQLVASDWIQLQEAGAVFLPAAGLRNGKSLVNKQVAGNYWSSTHVGAYGAYKMNFYSKGIKPKAAQGRFYGHSVRLARSAD